jgi:hypothetical protein
MSVSDKRGTVRGGAGKEVAMRRMVLTATVSAVVLALAPASALGRHNGHRRHHSRSHHAKVHRIRTKRFGDVSTPPATTPAPTTPGAPPADAVGTVTSFDGTTLVITLSDGKTTESGMVTSETEIECETMTPTTTPTGMPSGHDDGDGGQSGGQDQNGGDDNGQGDDDGQDDQNENENNQCTSANFTPGTFVRGAELKLSSAGAVWDKVDLIL